MGCNDCHAKAIYERTLANARNLKQSLNELFLIRESGATVSDPQLTTLTDVIEDCAQHEALAEGD